MMGAVAHSPQFRRIGVIWTVLLAFALQSYITQTHVHRVPAVAAQAAAPAGDEAVACPFCQAVAVAGAFVASPAPAVALPAVQARASLPPPSVTDFAVAPTGFSWRSRAPPQA